MSTDESTIEGIQDAVAAYQRDGGNIRNLIGFIARETFACQARAAFSEGDKEAITYLVAVNVEITRALEEIVLSHKYDDFPPIVTLKNQLKLDAQGRPWWPVLYGKGGSSRGESVVSRLDLGSKFPLKLNSSSLETPWIRLCFRLFSEVANLSIRLNQESLGTTKSPYHPSFYSPLSEPEKSELLAIFGRSNLIGPLSKETAVEWVNKIYIPYLLLKDPTLEMTPEAAGILKSKKVTEHGAKQEVFRSELSKHLVPAIKRLV
jgi:hypothetical protein